jgi:hypothetical protein
MKICFLKLINYFYIHKGAFSFSRLLIVNQNQNAKGIYLLDPFLVGIGIVFSGTGLHLTN